MVKIRKSKKDSKGFSQENHLRSPVSSGCLKTTEPSVNGSTMSNGLKIGSLVDHEKHGICYLGGCMENLGTSLHSLETGKRLCQNAKVEEMVVLSYNYFRWYKA